MLYAKTNELETIWSGISCEDPDCPGKMSKAERVKARRRAGKKLKAPNPDNLPTPKYMHLTLEEAHLQYSPGFW